MQKQVRNRCISILLAIIMVAGVFMGEAAETAGATELPSAGWQTCDVYTGTNSGAQDYSRWSSPIRSYLTACSDGSLMRVQSGASDKGLLVEYYDADADYQLLSSKFIPDELPIFGGFYVADQYYFLLTGQENPEESDETEVYRITKYDKDWNRLDSVGLKECNTTVPFDAGSARMDVEGNYLLIRTCHKMYKSEDGLNHQANVVIQVDMEKMSITDSFTGLMNAAFGYVSHSFNQFVKADNGHMVSVDHGDAYPRSMVLIKYTKEISSGTFASYDNKVINVLTFPGTAGENATGASAGGFEVSDTSYLIAGNSVVQDESNLTRKTRNVFVAAVDKTTEEVEIKWLTDYKEGDGTTSTPQMVKTGDGRYLVLWTRENKVYYTAIDGSGRRMGETYEFEGGLSDCVPTEVNGRLVWYTWENQTVAFYEILLSDLSKNQTKVFENGHAYEAQSEVTDDMLALKCQHCGREEQIKVVTGMNIFWNENGGTKYSSVFPSKKNVGDKIYYWINSVSPSEADNREIEVIVENPQIVQWTKTSETMGYFTMLSPGKTDITFRPRYNPAAARVYSAEVLSLQADPLPNQPESTIEASHSLGTVGEIKLPEGWGWQEADKGKVLTAGETITANAEYYGTDIGDGISSSVPITIKVDAHKGGTADCAKEAVCEICRKTYGGKNSQNHTGETVISGKKDATCTEKGYTGDKYCKSCNAKIASGKVTDMLGHNYVDGVCSRCKDKAEIPPKGRVIADNASKASFRVTKSGETGGTVEFIKSNANKSLVVVPNTVTIDGITYKVTGIAQNAFKNNRKITKATIGKNVLTIGKNAFSGCKNLKTATLGSKVTTIGDCAFYKCTSLTKVTIPASVSKIGKQAFYGDKKLKTVAVKTKKLKDKTVGKQAFKGIHAKASVKVPSSKLTAYRKLFKKKGFAGEKQKIKK